MNMFNLPLSYVLTGFVLWAGLLGIGIWMIKGWVKNRLLNVPRLPQAPARNTGEDDVTYRRRLDRHEEEQRRVADLIERAEKSNALTYDTGNLYQWMHIGAFTLIAMLFIGLSLSADKSAVMKEVRAVLPDLVVAETSNTLGGFKLDLDAANTQSRAALSNATTVSAQFGLWKSEVSNELDSIKTSLFALAKRSTNDLGTQTPINLSLSDTNAWAAMEARLMKRGNDATEAIIRELLGSLKRELAEKEAVTDKDMDMLLTKLQDLEERVRTDRSASGSTNTSATSERRHAGSESSDHKVTGTYTGPARNHWPNKTRMMSVTVVLDYQTPVRHELAQQTVNQIAERLHEELGGQFYNCEKWQSQGSQKAFREEAAPHIQRFFTGIERSFQTMKVTAASFKTSPMSGPDKSSGTNGNPFVAWQK